MICMSSAEYEEFQKAVIERDALRVSNLELERLCDTTYVAQGADAYNHACAGMEWLYKRIDRLEARLASRQKPAKTGETYCKNTDAAWAQFCGGVGDDPSAPHPGMIRAFESYYGQSFADKEWRTEASVWAAAWGKARTEEQPASDWMAYEGAREDLLDWKRRALKAEALNRKFANEVNGPSHMGEPTRLASEQEPRAWETFDGEGGYELRQFAENETYRDDFINRNGEKYAAWVEPLYAHPAPAQQPLSDGQIDFSIEAGDLVKSAKWKLTPLIVVDLNWALGAVALKLGERGDIVIWPIASITKDNSDSH
jgi:hypothetical protein